MEDKNKVEIDNNTSIPSKKPWLEPRVEIISHDNVQSGQAGVFSEGSFTGGSPFILYNS